MDYLLTEEEIVLHKIDLFIRLYPDFICTTQGGRYHNPSYFLHNNPVSYVGLKVWSQPADLCEN